MVKLCVKVCNKKNTDIYDYYDFTPHELADKCCIYTDGQIVFYNTLTEQEKDECWKGSVVPYDIYNYECFDWWEADEQTQGIIQCSRIAKIIRNYSIAKMMVDNKNASSPL